MLAPAIAFYHIGTLVLILGHRGLERIFPEVGKSDHA